MAATTKGKSKESSRAGGDPISALIDLFPITHPFPDPLQDAELIAPSDVALEQDLLLNLANVRSWNSYIHHVRTSNRPSDERTPFFVDADPSFSSAQVHLLGPLASASNRLALKRLTFAFERAVGTFPTSYGLWKDYLLQRMRYVLGEPTGGLDAFWKKQIRTGKEKLDVGPTLLDEKEDDWSHGTSSQSASGALDGRIGYKEWASLAAVFERALMYLPRLPRIWLLYFTVLTHPSCPPTLSYTHTRRTFDRALRTLPPSLHLRVWKLYLRWAESRGAETCVRVWRRYLQVDPSLTERYVRILERLADEQEDDSEEEEDGASGPARQLEAAKLLLRLAKDAVDGRYVSPEGKSAYQILLEWLEICERHAEQVGVPPEEDSTSSSVPDVFSNAAMLDPLNSQRLPVAHIVRTLGLAHFPDQAGRLWTGLATYWIRRGDLEAAKVTFEEGLSTVMTVRDFTQVFDAYAETSENIMGYMMDEIQQEDEEDADEREAKEVELDQRMKEFEELMERRPFLVNEVMIRRNPNDVQEWEKCVSLYGANEDKVIETYSKAFDTINPRKATANFHRLFLNFALFHERGGVENETQEDALESARSILERATTIPFVRVDDLAEIWCEWAEFEIRNGNFDGALRVMGRATVAPKTAAAIKAVSYLDDTLSAQKRLFKSSTLWTFYIDLEQSIGTVESARQCYDRMIELKIATPQVIINYAQFLEEHKYFEEAFRVYERGVDVFTYPIAFEIWNIYLSKFVKRYGAGKLERARDLFEQALEKCPAKYCRPLFLMYGKLEEDFGLAKRAMNIYQRATERVLAEDQVNMFLFYIAKVASNLGLASTRPVYERAIEVLPDRQTAHMCVRFAQLEEKLGEIDRARALYAHASQFCDPRTNKTFWQQWNAFEVEHGSEDTFREMLRIRRSVQAHFNTDSAYVAAYASAQRKANEEGGAAAAGLVDDGEEDAMVRAEKEASAGQRNGATLGGFVSAKETATKLPPTNDNANSERIGGGGGVNGDADDDDDEDLM